MATITALVEDFTTPAVGDSIVTTNSIFDSTNGTGTAIDIVDPFDSSLRMMEITTTGDNVTRGMDFTGVSTLWFRFDLDLDTSFSATTAILNGWESNAATLKFFDVRNQVGTRTLQLRDNNSSVAISPELAVGTKHRCYLNVQCSATAGITNRWLRLMIYSGGDNTALTWDSGPCTLTQANATIGHMKMGGLTSAAGKFRVGRFRADNASQPFPAATGTVSLAADNTTPAAGATVTLTATTTGTGTLVFTQTAGTTVTLSGTGSTRTFTAASGSTVSFTASYGGATSSTVTVTPGTTTTVTVNAGLDQTVEANTLVTLTATSTGTGTYAWSQTVGPTVTLSGTGATRTLTVPAALTTVTRTFQVTYGGQLDTVDVVTRPHIIWRKHSDGLHPVYTSQIPHS